MYKFCDKITDNYLTLECEGDICWIDKYYVDDENVKLFIVLLKEAFTKMIKLEIKKFVQYVTETEWNDFLKMNKNWTKVNDTEDGFVYISCDIADAMVCVMEGFGIKSV